MDKEFEELKNKSINEIDPRLRFDAFTAGVKDGGLRSVSSINLLVCYIVASIEGKVTAKNIIDSLSEGMLANYFEVTDAIAGLQKSGVIIEDQNGALSLADNNASDIELIEKDLPKTVRESAIRICQKIIAKENYMRENKVEIEKYKNGYEVILHVSDVDIDFMTLRLYATTRDQAEMIKDKFITDPVKVYDNLIESIFNN